MRLSIQTHSVAQYTVGAQLMFVDESMNKAKNWKEFKRSASRRMENSNAHRRVSRESPRFRLFKKKKNSRKQTQVTANLAEAPYLIPSFYLWKKLSSEPLNDTWEVSQPITESWDNDDD